jgi:hypothetical protein
MASHAETAHDDDRLRRLRAARATGSVDPDLVDWLIGLASASAAATPVATSPFQRLALRASEEADRWMVLRRLTWRTLSCSRRSLGRVLKAENVTLDTLADVADALGCDVEIEFRDRGRSGTTSTIDGTSA